MISPDPLKTVVPDPGEVARIVVQVAREEVLPGFRHPPAGALKADGSLVTEIDRRVQARLESTLSERWPQFGFLGEEMSAGQQRDTLAGEQVGMWCLDPVDGTSNYVAGLPFFSISLGLFVGGESALGVIYDPVRDEAFTARRGGGAQLNGTRIAPGDDVPLRRCIACVDFKRLPARLAGQLAHVFPYMSQRNIGSCALDWCWLALGRFRVYIHGGQKLWDRAAGALILDEAGGIARTLDGRTLLDSELEPRSVVAATTPGLFQAWQVWVEQNR